MHGRETSAGAPGRDDVSGALERNFFSDFPYKFLCSRYAKNYFPCMLLQHFCRVSIQRQTSTCMLR